MTLIVSYFDIVRKNLRDRYPTPCMQGRKAEGGGRSVAA